MRAVEPALPHPRRARDRRRVDQGLHDPARRAVRADAGAREAAGGGSSPERERELIAQLRHLPRAMEAVLAVEPQVRGWARRFQAKQHALFLGRGVHFPIAMEGALKLKEISYIHAEAYAAGRIEARAARAGGRRHAGGDGGAQRPAAREAQVEPAGSARARRRALRVRGPGRAGRRERGRARHPASSTTPGRSPPSCTSSRCSSSPTTSRSCAAPTSTSRVTSRRVVTVE